MLLSGCETLINKLSLNYMPSSSIILFCTFWLDCLFCMYKTTPNSNNSNNWHMWISLNSPFLAKFDTTTPYDTNPRTTRKPNSPCLRAQLMKSPNEPFWDSLYTSSFESNNKEMNKTGDYKFWSSRCYSMWNNRLQQTQDPQPTTFRF